MLETKSVDQVLDVLSKFRVEHSRGYPVTKAYQSAVGEVRKKYGVAYQTIGDLCRRRLGLRTIEGFYGLLEKWVVGDAEPLISVLMDNTKEHNHGKLIGYFEKKDGKVVEQKTDVCITKRESFNLSLGCDTVKKIKVLSLMEDDNSSVWLSRVVSEIVEQRYANWLTKQVV
jgi:hypothetical protein